MLNPFNQLTKIKVKIKPGADYSEKLEPTCCEEWRNLETPLILSDLIKATKFVSSGLKNVYRLLVSAVKRKGGKWEKRRELMEQREGNHFFIDKNKIGDG